MCSARAAVTQQHARTQHRMMQRRAPCSAAAHCHAQRSRLLHAMSSVGAPAARNEKPNDDTASRQSWPPLPMPSIASAATHAVAPSSCRACVWQQRGDVAMPPRSRSISHSRLTARHATAGGAHTWPRAGRPTHVCALLPCMIVCMHAHRLLCAHHACVRARAQRLHVCFNMSLFMILHARMACAPSCQLGSDPRAA